MDLHGKRLCEQQTQAANKTHDPITTTTTKPAAAGQTTHARRKPTKTTPTAPTHYSLCPTNRELILTMTKATATIKKQQTVLQRHSLTRVNHTTFCRSRNRPTSFQVTQGLQRKTWTHYLCMMRAIRRTGNGPRPTHLALRASESFVYRELNERVIIVVLFDSTIREDRGLD